MNRVVLDMSGSTITCRVPETTAEVLDLRVRIRCIADPIERMVEARNWLYDHIIAPPEPAPPWPETDGEDLPGEIWLFAVCDVLIARASLPPEVLVDIGRLEGRKAGIPDQWRPQSKCDCVRCRWNPEDGPMPELPGEHRCMWDGIDPRAALIVGELAGVTDLSQPYWAHQAWRELQQAQWRKYRHEEEQREKKTGESEEFKQSASSLSQMLRGGRRG